MLISQRGASRQTGGQGRPPVSLADLRRQLASPSAHADARRQRLLELARRLARIQALGDEYARVELSADAKAALGHAAGVA